MSKSNKSSFKPFVRVTILSAILAGLLIYLGINYHWGNYLNIPEKQPSVLALPNQGEPDKNDDTSTTTQLSNVVYDPKIIEAEHSNSLLDSMNKEQITEHCINLLSEEISDSTMLELATVNCVMSNYQETFQNTKTEAELKAIQLKRLNLKQQCQRNFVQNTNQSLIHKDLLIGICVSDRLNDPN